MTETKFHKKSRIKIHFDECLSTWLYARNLLSAYHSLLEGPWVVQGYVAY